MAINMHHNSPLGANKVESTKQKTGDSRGSEALDSKSEKAKLDKSNILMLGPTGSGKELECWHVKTCHLCCNFRNNFLLLVNVFERISYGCKDQGMHMAKT